MFTIFGNLLNDLTPPPNHLANTWYNLFAHYPLKINSDWSLPPSPSHPNSGSITIH